MALDHWGIIGDFGHLMLRGVGRAPSTFAPHIPALLFMAYQMMFAIITPTSSMHPADLRPADELALGQVPAARLAASSRTTCRDL